MKFTLLDLYSFSIGIASVIGWIRYQKIHSAFYPFLYCITLAFLTEIIGYFLMYNGYSNAVVMNIYAIAEALLLTWQFQRWQLFHRYRKLYIVILVSVFVFWCIESFFISGIHQPITYFRVFYSSIIVLMSIDVLNAQMMRERMNILRNPIGLVCLVFVIYYTFTIVVGVFWIYGFGGSRAFRRSMVWILIYINLFANLVYALAVLWMPKKLRFTLPY